MMNFICDYKELHGDKQLSLLDNLNYKTSRKDEIIEYLKNKKEFYDGVRCSTLKDLVKKKIHICRHMHILMGYIFGRTKTHTILRNMI